MNYSPVPRMFISESAQAFLKPGEDLLTVDFWEARHGWEEAETAPGVVLAKHMDVALTSQRLLIFKGGLVAKHTSELLCELPIADVELETISHWFKSFEVILKARGVDHRLICPHIGQTNALKAALDKAKSGAPRES